MARILNPALAQYTRVVAVTVPRADSADGRVLAFLDLNEPRAFTAAEIGRALGMDEAWTRQTLNHLGTRGLVIAASPGRGSPRGRYAWRYRIAPDLAPHLPAKLAARLADHAGVAA